MNKQNGPWQIISTDVKYKNPWISVREDKVIQPDGKPGIFGVVTMVAGSSVMPVDDDGNVFLTKEFQYGVGHITFEVISGGIDEGETPLEAAKRELKEEAGFVASEWIELGAIDPFTSVVVSPNHLFVAKGLTETDKALGGTEIIEILKVPYAKALKMVMDGEITHGASVAVILMARDLFKKNPFVKIKT